jgi:hypothetical protein
MFFQSERWFLFIATLGCFVLPRCAASQDVVSPKSDATPPTQQSTRVVLLKPLLRFEDTRVGGSTITPAGDDGFESLLLSAAKIALGPKTTTVAPESLQPPATEASARLNEASSRLARGNVTDQLKTDLNLLVPAGERGLVLAHFVRIKVGPGSSWNSFTGAITSAMDSTLVEVALVCSNSGKVVWKNEQFIRKALKPGTSDFNKMLTLLYQGLEIKPGGVQCE